MVVIPRAAAAVLQPAGGYRVALAQPGATPAGESAVESLGQDAQVTDYSTSFRDRQSLRGQAKFRDPPAPLRRNVEQARGAPNTTGANLIASGNAEFASFFEAAAASPVGAGGKATASSSTVSNGIESYEKNVRVTRGELPVKGENLNIKL